MKNKSILSGDRLPILSQKNEASMVSRQEEVIGQVRSFGRSLGFVSEDEQSVGKHIIKESYRPRLDVTWSVDLQAAGFDLTDVSALTDNRTASLYGLIGAEVEVSRPTTKRHFSNLANLTLARLPFSMLVVDVSGEADMFRRANRAIRAFNYRYGRVRLHQRYQILVEIGYVGRCRSVMTYWRIPP